MLFSNKFFTVIIELINYEYINNKDVHVQYKIEGIKLYFRKILREKCN